MSALKIELLPRNAYAVQLSLDDEGQLIAVGDLQSPRPVRIDGRVVRGLPGRFSTALLTTDQLGQIDRAKAAFAERAAYLAASQITVEWPETPGARPTIRTCSDLACANRLAERVSRGRRDLTIQDVVIRRGAYRVAFAGPTR